MSTEDSIASIPTSRRDALKMTGAAAAGAAVFWSGLSALSSAAGASEVAPLAAAGVVTSAEVTIGGVKLANVTIAGYGEMDTEVVEYKDPEDQTTRYRPGNNKTTRIKITREWSNDTTFIDWYENNSTGTPDLRQIHVAIFAGTTNVATLVATNCWPVSWIGPALDKSLSSAHATESLVISADSFTYSK
jgi:phage tail-like protein